MARPLAWLAFDGIKDNSGNPLANGSLYFYTPGTTTQTAVYADKDQSAILTQPVATDAYGRATVFTEGPVKIAPFDSLGAAVTPIDRVNAQHATEVEVESDYFTGTTSTGATATGGRVQLATAIDRIGTSLGGVDGNFKHTTGGTERAVNVVISERGLSVKDKGALGNDSAIDTAAIKSAIAALKSAGGGKLIFPPGTYRIDDELIVDFNGLDVEGYGDSSIIKSTVTNKNGFTVSGAYTFRIKGVTFACTGSSTMACVECTDTVGGLVDSVKSTGFDFGVYVKGAASGFNVVNCYLIGVGANSKVIRIAGSAGAVKLIGNVIGTASAGNGVGVALEGSASDIALLANNFGSLSKAFNMVAAATGTDVFLDDNLMSQATTAIDIEPTHAVRARYENNEFGTKLISDASTISITPAASNLDLGGASDHYEVQAGNFTYISKLGIPRRKKISLKFSGASTVTHAGGAPGAGYADVYLSGAVNFGATANDTLTLVFDGTNWFELARTVI